MRSVSRRVIAIHLALLANPLAAQQQCTAVRRVMPTT